QTGMRVSSAGISFSRTAYPSIALMSAGGLSRSAATASARMRPAALPMATSSRPTGANAAARIFSAAAGEVGDAADCPVGLFEDGSGLDMRASLVRAAGAAHALNMESESSHAPTRNAVVAGVGRTGVDSSGHRQATATRSQMQKVRPAHQVRAAEMGS